LDASTDDAFKNYLFKFLSFWKINSSLMTKILELRGNIFSREEAVPPQEKIMQESERYLSPITHFKDFWKINSSWMTKILEVREI